MKFGRVTSFFIIVLLLCGINMTAAIAGSELPICVISNGTEDTHISKGINVSMSGDAGVISGSNIVISLNIPEGSGYDPLPTGFSCTGSAISFTLPDTLSNTFEMDCGDTDFSQLHSNLDSVSIYSILEKEGAYYSIYLPIEWDFSTVDAVTPGAYTACGNILLPSGAALADGLESTIHITVQVKSPPEIPSQPPKIVLTAFDEQYRMDAAAFELGTSMDELSEWFADYYDGFTGYDSQGNYYYLMTEPWSFENVNTGTPGVYYASASPALGEDYVLGDGVPLPRLLFAVSIQSPDKPDINCCVSARGFIVFPWVLSTELQDQLDQFTVRMRQNNGTWEQMDENSCIVISDGLRLSQRILEPENTYELQVSYPGGQTGILTFEYDGSLTIIDYSGGDRDGGDVGGGSPLTGSQPAPDPVNIPGSSDNDNDDSDGDDDDYDDDRADPVRDTQPAPEPNITPLENISVPNENHSPAPIEPIPESLPILPEIMAPKPIKSTSVPYTIATKPPRSELSEVVSELSPASKVILAEPVSLQPDPLTELDQSSQQDSASAAETKPDASSSKAQESFSPTQTVISGLRLRDLCEGEKSVVFGAGSVTVSIPSQLLLALNLADTNTLSVDLTQPEENQVVLAVNTPDGAVTKLPGTIMRLRYVPQSEASDITVYNAAGTKIPDAKFDGEFLRFIVDTAGTYTILETDAVQESKFSRNFASPLLPMVGAGLLLSIGGTAFIRRIRHG